MEKIGIFFGSSTGNTEGGAEKIRDEFGADVAEVINATDANASKIEEFSNVIFGASTWGIGDIQEDFEELLPEISSANLEGKKVAIFGFGDQDSYDSSFVDAIGDIFEAVKDKGCEVVGKVSTDGYSYSESRAEVDGEFVGLPLDDDNQSELTDERIKNWVNQLKGQFN